jgi:hypothetical protein
MLVLPVSTTAMWRWAMRQREPAAALPHPTHKTAPRADAAPPLIEHDDQLRHAR